MEKLTQYWDSDSSFNITRLTSADEPCPMHTHDFYEYFIVIHGQSIHVVNNSVQKVERGSLVLVRPSDEHCYDYCKSQDFQFYNINVLSDLFDQTNLLFLNNMQKLTTCSLPHHVKLNEAQLSYVQDILTQIQDTPDEDSKHILSVNIFVYCMCQLIKLPEFDEMQIMPQWLVSTLDEMSKPENFIIGLPHLLKITNYSQEHVNRVFKRFLNTTPTKYINEMRLRYAFQLIQIGKNEIIDVCQMCGFNSLNHFYVEFKKYYGFTPKKSRNYTECDM